MSGASWFEVQIQQAEENALVGDLVDRGIALIEKVERYQARVEQAAEIRAARPQRRRNGRKRPPGHLSRQILDDLDQIGVALAEAVRATSELRRGDSV